LGKTVGMVQGKVKLRLGEHRMEDVRNADMVIRNPGVPNSSPYLAEARRLGIPVMTDVSVFLTLCRCPVIGITGTRGKSTTTALMGEIMKTVNKKTYVGGNIQRSPLTFLEKLNEGSIVVLELSSWLAESLADIAQSPWGAVVTNIYPDHLNVHGSMEEYIRAKEQIFRFQEAGHPLVLNYDNAYTRKMAAHVPKGVAVRWFSLKPLPKKMKGAWLDGTYLKVNGKIILSVRAMELQGDHNIANALAAAALADAVGVPIKNIREAVRGFGGLPNRQEIIREFDGITWVNDTTATTPEATIAALERFGKGKKKKIILIGGGTDKKLEFKALAQAIKKYCKSVVLFEGSATDKLRKQLGAHAPLLGFSTTMRDAVQTAYTAAKRGDIILLSPGAASFGLFQNEFDRGDQFATLVKKLK
ncbi:MAG: UDP-N-acetylmuramoyl-L-alanine--D-glutamate ligase, partial [bacterium]|nr:UDP-N-acetylmuramoyl-L-alanine--D-glutamate ligase [bacterium]